MTTAISSLSFQERTMEDFTAACQVLREKMTADYKGENYFVDFEVGRKYTRIVKTFCSNRSCAGFIVSVKNHPVYPFGTLLKSAGWKQPELNFQRGNLFDLEGKTVRWTGII